jgi:pheromone shutdown protein TraB
MADTAKNKSKALVIGTKHQYQRHQDTNAGHQQVRARFEERLRQVIDAEDIDLIAEEAGDDTAVWEHLKRQDELLGEYIKYFGGKTVDSPVPTIAKKIADERPGELRHVDIRAPNAAEMSMEERDEAMVRKVMEVLGNADSVVVIVGENHRAGVAQRLSESRLDVKSFHFPE